MMFPTRVLWILAIALWISAGGLFLAGFLMSGAPKILMWAAIPDAILAAVVSAFAVNRSMNRR